MEPHLEPVCSSCQVQMDRGFVLDQGYGHISQGRWVKGDPRSPQFMGVKFGEVNSEQFKGALRVWMYRCPECGRLEAYAFEDDK